ncbi:DNA polymerase III subunit gamma and tau [Brevibacterium metallidurans]|uniref:DNA-directed DNA polymerase n=1 Tax=Brevibacterium metallidurans TaxID=1482676 RepID=A0ABN0SPV9_9MICO
MSTALYRRYRPETFDEVIGQEHVTEPLKAAIERGRINHAYLFSGPRGCGKTTSARILARCLNCEKGPTPVPCGECPSCLDLANGGPGSLDVVEIDAASHNGVDDARDLRERAIYAPARDRYKVFILDEAHMVTSQGFNALLKIVEEPPPHIKFIFATTEPEKVIGTIRSRTHHYPFRLVPPEALGNYLEELCRREDVQVDKGVLPLVVRAGGGSVRDTLSVLDQLIAGSGPGGVDYSTAVALLGYTPDSLLSDIVDAFSAGDGAGVYRAIERVIESGQDPRRFVEDLLERMRDLIVIHAAPEAAHAFLPEVPPDRLERLTLQARGFGQAELSRAADILNQGLTEMSGATSPRLQLELIAARILLPASGRSRDAVLSRVERMERRIGMSASGSGGTVPAQAGPEATGAGSTGAGSMGAGQTGAGQGSGAGQAGGQPGGGQHGGAGQPAGAGSQGSAQSAQSGGQSSAAAQAPSGGQSSAPDDFDELTAIAAAAESMLNDTPAAEPRGAAQPGGPQPGAGQQSDARQRPDGRSGGAQQGEPSSRETSSRDSLPRESRPDSEPGPSRHDSSQREARPAPEPDRSQQQATSGPERDSRPAADPRPETGSGPAQSSSQRSDQRGGDRADGSRNHADGRAHSAAGDRNGAPNQTRTEESPLAQAAQRGNGNGSSDSRDRSTGPQTSTAADEPTSAAAPASSASQSSEGTGTGSTDGAGAGGIGGEIEAIRRAWPNILAAVEKRSRLTRAIIAANAIPQSFSDGVVYLGFNNAGSVQGFQQRDHAAKLAMAINDVLGIEARIDIGDVGRIGGNSGGPVASGGSAPSSGQGSPASQQNRGPGSDFRRPSPEEVAAVVGTREVDKPQVDREKFWETGDVPQGPWSSDDEEGETGPRPEPADDSALTAPTPDETEVETDRDVAQGVDGEATGVDGVASSVPDAASNVEDASAREAVQAAAGTEPVVAGDSDDAGPGVDGSGAAHRNADSAASSDDGLVVPDLSDEDFFGPSTGSGHATTSEPPASQRDASDSVPARDAQSTDAESAMGQPPQSADPGSASDASTHRADEVGDEPMEYVQPRWEEPVWHDAPQQSDPMGGETDSTSAGSGAVDVGAVVVPPPEDDDLDYLGAYADPDADFTGQGGAAPGAGQADAAPGSDGASNRTGNQPSSQPAGGGAKPFKSRFAAIAERHGMDTGAYSAPSAPPRNPAPAPASASEAPGSGPVEDEYDPETDLDITDAPQVGVAVIAKVLGGEIIDERDV